MLFCKNCGSKKILFRLTTALFVPVNPETGELVFDTDNNLGRQARANIDTRNMVAYCSRCSAYFRIEDLSDPTPGRRPEIMGIDTKDVVEMDLSNVDLGGDVL